MQEQPLVIPDKQVAEPSLYMTKIVWGRKLIYQMPLYG
jgi:hypothetical protein